ncbi:SC31A protein, partial [Polypterus senegalus]
MEVVPAEVNSLLPEEIMDTEAIVLVEDDQVDAAITVGDSQLVDEIPMETELPEIVSISSAVSQKNLAISSNSSEAVLVSSPTTVSGSSLLLSNTNTTHMTRIKSPVTKPIAIQTSGSVGLQKVSSPVVVTSASQLILNKMSHSTSDLKSSTTQVIKQEGQKLIVTTLGKSGPPIVLTLPGTSQLTQSPKGGQGQGATGDSKVQPQQYKVVTIGGRTDIKPVIGVQAVNPGNQLINTHHSGLQSQSLKALQQLTVVSMASQSPSSPQKSVGVPLNVALGQQILTVQPSTPSSPVKPISNNSKAQAVKPVQTVAVGGVGVSTPQFKTIIPLTTPPNVQQIQVPGSKFHYVRLVTASTGSSSPQTAGSSTNSLSLQQGCSQTIKYNFSDRHHKPLAAKTDNASYSFATDSAQSHYCVGACPWCRKCWACLDRNPEAFKPKIGKGKEGESDRRHSKGCNCKRSGCLKNYCECYEAKIMCSSICKCIGCKNFEESPERKTLMHLADAAEVRVQQQTAAKTKLSSQISDLLTRTPAVTSGSGSMKLKEINRTAIQAWSHAQQYPVFLAAGTSAQQLDATFSTNASLEIFELDLADTTLDMKSSGAFTSEHRYHKLVWGPHGINSEGLPSGILIAGGENGNLVLYDPAKIIAGDSDVTIAQNNKHTGPVRALDINPFQPNLVVSGANESEIYIWDLNNFGTPMTPGAKSQPFEDISSVAWNKQVQHIMASASPSGRASVWDLRKNELIIKVSDHSNRMHCSGLAWNPEVATQLILASEDDRMPVIQMWDLRFYMSCLPVLSGALTYSGVREIQLFFLLLPLMEVSVFTLSWEFGGKLVTFENIKTPSQQPSAPRLVHVSQVVTETEFLDRSNQLQTTVQSGSFAEFCQFKIDASQTELEKNVWSFLKINFERDPRSRYLELLGYKKEKLAEKIATALQKNSISPGGREELICEPEQEVETAECEAVEEQILEELITAVVTKDWKEIAQSCDLNNWREALAAVLTYAHPDEFAGLCDLLGTRLEKSGDPALQAQACLCYICAGNVEKLIACWTKTQDGSSPLSLQDLIEKVTVLRKAVEMTQGVNTNNVGVLLAEKMSQYSNLLASQGSLNTAMAYLPCNTNQGNIMLLCDRLHRALGEQAIGQPAPAFPYEKQHSTRQPTSAKQICTPVPQNQPQTVPQQYYPQVRPAPTVTSWSNQTPTALPGFPPAASSSFSSSSDTQLPEDYTPPAPITAPIMNPLVPDQSQQLAHPPVFQPQQSPAGPPLSQPAFQMMQQPLSQPSVVTPTRKLSTEGPPGAPIGDVIQPPQYMPAEKVAKNPIPEEHLILKITFEGLINRCLSAAVDPQTKRKLDDANKRLESLYDKLCEKNLSAAIITGLHSIARSIENRNYLEGLAIHTHIVSNSNFSETSAFMPVLKVVLTQANKLGV